MTRRSLPVIVTALMAANLSVMAQVNPRPAEVAHVSGAVVSTDSPPQPIRGAIVSLAIEPGSGSSGAAYPFARITDEQGRFAFQIPPGRYRLSAKKPAYLDAQYGALQPGAAGTPLAIAANDRIDNITIKLPRGAVITGTITDLRGNPAANVLVSAATSTRAGYGINAVSTDERGMYRIFGVQPNDYYVIASHPGAASNRQVEVITSQQVDAALAGLERIYNRGGVQNAAPATRAAASPYPAPSQNGDMNTLYPGTPDAGNATVITVGAGDVREGINFPLMLAGGASINGVVVGADGQPVSNAPVSVAIDSASGERTFTTRTSSGADGTFRVTNVSSGRQTILARLLTFPAPSAAGRSPEPGAVTNRPNQWAMAEVDVSSLFINGVTLALRPSLTFSGRVVFDGTTPASPTAAQVTVATVGSSIAPVNADGTFRVNGVLPGVARITASSPGWQLRSILLNDRNLLDFPLEIDLNSSDISGAVVTFTDRRTQLSGTLQTPAGTPAPNYFVAVFPADRSIWHPRSARFAATRPGTDGRFDFPDLPAGDYVMVALTGLNPDTWKRPEFLDPLVGSGLRVTLVEGVPKSQDLRMAR